jgi:hypothetical protein
MKKLSSRMMPKMIHSRRDGIRFGIGVDGFGGTGGRGGGLDISLHQLR